MTLHRKLRSVSRPSPFSVLPARCASSSVSFRELVVPTCWPAGCCGPSWQSEQEADGALTLSAKPEDQLSDYELPDIGEDDNGDEGH